MDRTGIAGSGAGRRAATAVPSLFASVRRADQVVVVLGVLAEVDLRAVDVAGEVAVAAAVVIADGVAVSDPTSTNHHDGRR